MHVRRFVKSGKLRNGSALRPVHKTWLRVLNLESRIAPADISAPAFLQWFETTDATMERRLADFFQAGYGGIWAPPPGRADQGNFSVGYDPYDRFDLGGPNNYTLYGSETGLKTVIQETNKA